MFSRAKVAASSPGDCAFEDDECGWSNPERRDNVDELNWERSTAAEGGRSALHLYISLIKVQLGGFFSRR
jgi:hypothetical protein